MKHPLHERIQEGNNGMQPPASPMGAIVSAARHERDAVQPAATALPNIELPTMALPIDPASRSWWQLHLFQSSVTLFQVHYRKHLVSGYEATELLSHHSPRPVAGRSGFDARSGHVRGYDDIWCKHQRMIVR